MATEIIAATASDEASIVQTIVLAFSSDPMARWCWPNAHRYVASMPPFIQAFSGRAFQDGSAHCTDDRRGAALWLPPGIEPDEERMARVVEETMTRAVRGDLHGVMEARARFRPAEPHWYLTMLGVDPPRQGKGYGSALLAHALRQVDKSGALAYLESSNPRNIPLYERHGFRVTGRIQAGTSPLILAMLRKPANGTGE